MYDPQGRLIGNAIERQGFTSQEIVRNADGSFDVVVAPRARAGNWLPTNGVDSYLLVLRLYDFAGRRRHPRSARSADASGRAVMLLRSFRRSLAMIRWLLWLLAGALLGGIVHLVAVLILPRTATQDAYSRLAPVAPVNAVTRGAAAQAAERTDAVHGSGLCLGGLPL